MALTPEQLANLAAAYQQAQARLTYLRASAKLGGMTEGVKREITKATTARDRVRREIKASESGTTYRTQRQRSRDYQREARLRRERKAKLASGEVQPRPLTNPEYELVQHYKRTYQFITEDFRNRPNDRQTLSIVRRTGDTISQGKKPTRRLERDYEAYTGQPFPWESWRQAYIATKIVPWNPPDGFTDDEAA